MDAPPDGPPPEGTEANPAGGACPHCGRPTHGSMWCDAHSERVMWAVQIHGLGYDDIHNALTRTAVGMVTERMWPRASAYADHDAFGEAVWHEVVSSAPLCCMVERQGGPGTVTTLIGALCGISPN